MAEYKTEEVTVKFLGDVEDQFISGDDWIPMYDPNVYLNEYTFEGVQSVPDITATPFLGQPNYPTIGAAPGWMTENFQNGGKFKTGEIGDAHVDHGEIPIVSPAPSTASSFAFSEAEEKCEPRDERYLKLISSLGIDEKQLQKFSVKELNQFLKSKGLSREQQQCVKSRRRTLKNRGYAQNCRVKRINQKKSLESQNEDLLKELDQLRADLENTKKEREFYKSKFLQLAKFVKQLKKTA